MNAVESVVARFIDGRTVGGTTDHFSPDQPSFVVHMMDSMVPVRVRLRELKAVFFVKSLIGDSDRHEVRVFPGSPRRGVGEQIAVRFIDGEVACGYSDGYDPGAPGFFMEPASPNSNNKLSYVLAHAVEVVRVGAAAEALLRESLKRAG
jgi:hypothetical protein